MAMRSSSSSLQFSLWRWAFFTSLFWAQKSGQSKVNETRTVQKGLIKTMICVPISSKLHSAHRTAPSQTYTHNPWHSFALGASCVVNVTRTKRSASTRWCSERWSHLLETWCQFIVSNKFGASARAYVCALCRVHVRDAVKNWTHTHTQHRIASSERWKTTIEHFSWPALCQEVYKLRQWQ